MVHSVEPALYCQAYPSMLCVTVWYVLCFHVARSLYYSPVSRLWPTYVQDRIWHRCADRSLSCITTVSTPPFYSCGLRCAPNLPLVSIFLLLLLTTRGTALRVPPVWHLHPSTFWSHSAAAPLSIFPSVYTLLCYFHSRFLELRLLLWMLLQSPCPMPGGIVH